MANKITSLKPKYKSIDFDGGCIDPIAKLIIMEAMDYAIESAVETVNKSGDIFSSLGQAGYGGLRFIKGIRDVIAETPSCERSLSSGESKLIDSFSKESGKATKSSKESSAPKTPKAKPLPEILTPEAWNTLPLSVRDDLVNAAEINKSGGTAAGSFTPEEFEQLKMRFERPKETKPRMVKLVIVKKRDPETGIVQQAGFDVISNDRVTRRLSVAEGAQLIDEGKAYIV